MKELIEADKNQLESRSEAYFEAILDFLKWTSTITIAAMLWLGDNLRSLVGWPFILGVIALASMFASLVIAFIVARRATIAASKDWAVAIADSALVQQSMMKEVLLSIVPAEDLKARLEQKERETSDRKWSALKAAQPFSQPEGFDRWMTGCVIALLGGVLVYICAQVPSVLLA